MWDCCKINMNGGSVVVKIAQLGEPVQQIGIFFHPYTQRAEGTTLL